MTKELKIVKNPNPILRKKSSKILSDKIFEDEFKQLCEDMSLTMQEKDGVGLAAPQIGKNIRLIVINSKDGPITIINPKIVKKSFSKEYGEEGCLSVPNVFGKVKRYKKITCSYLNLKNDKKKIKASGLLSRVIQHEIDHLDGILFIDKAIDMKETN